MRRKRKSKRRRVVLSIVVPIAVLVIGFVAWIGVRGLLAKDALERAIPLTDDLKQSVLDADAGGAQAQFAELRALTSTAESMTSDPLWALVEGIPGIGSNFTVVREAAAIVNDVTLGVEPMVEIAGSLTPASLKPVDGRFDLTPILEARDGMEAVQTVIDTALERTHAIDTTETLGPVNVAVEQLDAGLSQVDGLLTTAAPMLEILPDLLGAEGQRRYLLAFQNNAEVRSLGGNAASLALITVDDGAIDIAQQATSGDFGRNDPVLDLGTTQSVYTNNLPDGVLNGYMQDMAMVPDFPTMGALARAWWARDIGGDVDAVASFDPIALSYLLAATGPVTLDTGDVLTGENAVQMLLSEVYARYPDPVDQDAFFSSAARKIFDVVKSGAGDPDLLLPAVLRSVEEGRLMLWSTREEEQAVLATTPLAGVLPPANDKSTTVGVYFNDHSSSKLSYYLRAAVDVVAECTADGVTTTTTVAVSSVVPPNWQDLPSYVLSTYYGPMMRLEIAALGPIGSSAAGFDPRDSGAELVNAATDKGRIVMRSALTLQPGETKTMTFVTTTPAGAFGPLELRTTPMVAPVDSKVGALTCAL